MFFSLSNIKSFYLVRTKSLEWQLISQHNDTEKKILRVDLILDTVFTEVGKCERLEFLSLSFVKLRLEFYPIKTESSTVNI